jgi:hypothetical protein
LTNYIEHFSKVIIGKKTLYLVMDISLAFPLLLHGVVPHRDEEPHFGKLNKKFI